MDRLRVLVVLSSVIAMVCSPPPADDGTGVGVVMVAITAAPADVSCVQIRAEGTRTVTRSFDVTPGASTVLKMNGLPLGALTFSGQAFASTCAGVTAASDPTWVADAVATTVVAGVVGSVTLTMRRNGNVNVSVDFVDDVTPPSPDPTCNTVLAKTGALCTQDCSVACGFAGIGTKTCICSGGAFSACPCPRPPTFMGAPTAPLCATPDGTTTTLRNTPCATEWDECIGTDPVSGTTPQGCVCLVDATGALTWTCGSTNKWFSLDPTAP
jgi:hypothetical protein